MATKKGAKKKQITDTKRQQMRKEEKESLLYEYRNEIGFIGVSTLSIILFLANLGFIGPIGKGIKSLSFGLFGFLAWIFPFFLFFFVMIWMANSENTRVKVKIWLSFAIFLFLASLAELISYPTVAKISLQDLYLFSADKGNGGGLLGGILAKYLASGLALVGAYLVLVSFLILFIIFLTGRFFVNPIKRRAEETKNHLVELKNEQLEEARRRAEIKREWRKEARDLKREERERAREERIQKLREMKLIHEEEFLVRPEKSFASERLEEVVENKSLNYQDEPILSPKETVTLREIGEAKKVDLSAILNKKAEAPKEQKGEEAVYQTILESKFGKEEIEEDSSIATSSGEITKTEKGPSWSLLQTNEVALKEEFPNIPSKEEIEKDGKEDGTLKQETLAEESFEIPIFEKEIAEKFGREGADVRAKISSENILEKEAGNEKLLVEGSLKESDIEKENFEKFNEVFEGKKEELPEDEVEEEPLEDDISEYENFLDEDEEAYEEELAASLLGIKLSEDIGQRAKSEVFEEDAKNIDEWEEEELPKTYHYPPVELLSLPEKEAEGVSDSELQETADKLQKTLEAFGVRAKVTEVSCGPSVTRYELQPEIGVKVSKITSLSDDIKLNLAAADIRIEAPIPGKAAVGIEVPNKTNTMVYFRELIESKEFDETASKLSFAVGKDIAGKTMVTDIAKMPHLLIAGATGSGKSVCINTLIMSILYKAKADEVKFIMIDPKVVELSCYNGIPHLLLPVVTDPKKAAAALNWAVAEMNRRYTLFAEEGVRNIKGFNKAIGDESPNWLPQIVIIVDELADLMMVSSKDVEEAICRLAQLARAAGIHLVIATQRPSVNVITGLIKANIPSRIAFAVSSQVDSRTILDGAGAEKLLGKGDMLFFPSGYPKPVRVQGAFVSDNEVAALVDFLREHNSEAHTGEDISEAVNQVAAESIREIADKSQVEEPADDYDEYFDEAGKFIIEKQKASIGMLQRVYRIGFNRAARIMDQLAEAGVVSEEDGTRARKILMSKEDFLQFLAFRHGEEADQTEETEEVI